MGSWSCVILLILVWHNELLGFLSLERCLLGFLTLDRDPGTPIVSKELGI